MGDLVLFYQNLSFFFVLFYLLSLIFFLHSCSCSNNIPALFNESSGDPGWSLAGATWYGSPNGAGSDGGACGYGKYVEGYPFFSLVSAGGPSLYQSGRGCGGCYQVKCTSNAACSGNPVTVVITDECSGCTSEFVHFDLSGTAFGAMAVSSKEENLRNAGAIQIQYQRVTCNYGVTKIAFHVDLGSNPYYFATLVEYEDGEGEVGGMDLQDGSGGSWKIMQQSWGAVWKLNAASALEPPFSLRLTQPSGHTIVATNVIPVGWVPGQTYQSEVIISS